MPLKILSALLLLVLTSVADAQSLIPESPASEAQAPQIPDVLTPEIVDGMLARLTDAEIRELLRVELVRRAEAQAAAETEAEPTFAGLETRLSEMAERISTRVTRWATALANIGDRRDRVAQQLELAQGGPGIMIVAAAALVLAGILAGRLAQAIAGRWTYWLRHPHRDDYWDKVIRTVALGLVDFLPVIAFVAVTRLLAPALADWLGPLSGEVWIYQTGVSYCWAIIILARRAFAPHTPQIRIAPLTDAAATGVYELIRIGAIIGTAGWVLAGLAPNLGLGFAPALVTVALSGTLVALLFAVAIARNTSGIRASVRAVLSEDGTSFGRIAVATAPGLLGLYLFWAWLFWLAHWLERGQHQLDGPIGSLVVALLLPLADRLGAELVRSFLRGQEARAVRIRQVFTGAWRALMAIVSLVTIARLWGLDLLALSTGENAAPWAGAALDILVTLLLGVLVWRLVRAALHTEKYVAGAAEDAEAEDTAGTSRLDTLTPLFRNLLLGFLAIIVTIIVLSAMGVDVGPLIASAGIIGIAVGFGAQALVRDIFSGIFFLIDDAFRVGEYIELDSDIRGEVESISIRSLQLRHHRGPVITIPFGELKQITNHNRDWIIYKMSFRLEPDTDPLYVKRVVKDVAKELSANPEHGPKFIEPLKSQGVLSIDDDSALIMRVKFKCRPRAQFTLRREIYHRLRTVFAEKGIQFARRKVEVVSANEGEEAELAKGAALGEPAVAPTG